LVGAILMALTRMTGAVASRPTEPEMDALRARGAALLARAGDPLGKARYHAGEGFYAFWLTGDRPPTDAEIAASEAHATEALALARSIDDVGLQSIALDALGAGAMQHHDWTRSRDIARSRLPRPGRAP